MLGLCLNLGPSISGKERVGEQILEVDHPTKSMKDLSCPVVVCQLLEGRWVLQKKLI